MLEILSGANYAISSGVASQVNGSDAKRHWIESALASTAVLAAAAALDTWFNGEAREIGYLGEARGRLVHLQTASALLDCIVFEGAMSVAVRAAKTLDAMLTQQGDAPLKAQVLGFVAVPSHAKAVQLAASLLERLATHGPLFTQARTALKGTAPGSQPRIAALAPLSTALTPAAVAPALAAPEDAALDTFNLLENGDVPAGAAGALQEFQRAVKDVPENTPTGGVCSDKAADGTWHLREAATLRDLANAELAHCMEERQLGHGPTPNPSTTH